MSTTIVVEKVPASSLFVTEEFRASDWIAEVCEDLDVWVTDEPLPLGHFGTYFGALTRRTYPSPFVQDLYYLHELVHVRTFGYRPEDSWLQWSRRMIRSEFEASVASECIAYLRIPGLREKTFSHEIWVDRFLKEPYRIEAELEARIRKERVRALNNPDYDDPLEHQIWNYCRQNPRWCRIWATDVGFGKHAYRPAFRAVELHMASADRDATHQAWLEEVTQLGPPRVPFPRQAEAFTPVYKRSGEDYGNDAFSR